MAIFVARHFVEELKKNKDFKEGKYEKALETIFFRMDEVKIFL